MKKKGGNSTRRGNVRTENRKLKEGQREEEGREGLRKGKDRRGKVCFGSLRAKDKVKEASGV